MSKLRVTRAAIVKAALMSASILSSAACGISAAQTTATAATVGSSPEQQNPSRVTEAHYSEVRCYSVGDPEGHFADVTFPVMTKAGKTSMPQVTAGKAKDACAALFREGRLVEGVAENITARSVVEGQVPELFVCKMDVARFAVFPSSSCEGLGLDEA
ncbi:hypothetical protein [Microbispora hainanensis]|uniref:Lipoprotein n=1 Tax=Microbispora hainanensis TaxID=568844 RepID=A0A544XJV7_9ACTN|nr:hypothetical protein [Microbispora hainanensis]TQS04764.1 hypothetical protein FLX08_39815 [Microbispora hainanensis]